MQICETRQLAAGASAREGGDRDVHDKREIVTAPQALIDDVSGLVIVRAHSSRKPYQFFGDPISFDLQWLSFDQQGVIHGCRINRPKPKGDKFFWNIDAKVGAMAPNRGIDVQLVQVGYRAMLKTPANTGKLSAAEIDAISKIRPGAICTGREDDPLVRAIRAHEQRRGGPQDGVVSPLGQNHIGYFDGTEMQAMILLALNNSLKDVLGNGYPHIDQYSECPLELKNLALTMFGRR